MHEIKWEHIAGTKYISNFITCAEYQPFLDEQQKRGKFYQPDHWTQCHYLKGFSQKPITGIRCEDADAFCSWLTDTELNTSQYTYYLPTEQDVINNPIFTEHFESISCWSYENGHYNLVWKESYNKPIYLEIETLLYRDTNKNYSMFHFNQKDVYELYNLITEAFLKCLVSKITEKFKIKETSVELFFVLFNILQRGFQETPSFYKIENFHSLGKIQRNHLEGLPFGLVKALTIDEEYYQRKNISYNNKVERSIGEYIEESLIYSMQNALSFIFKGIKNESTTYTTDLSKKINNARFFSEKINSIIYKSDLHEAFCNFFNPNTHSFPSRLKNAWNTALLSLLKEIVDNDILFAENNQYANYREKSIFNQVISSILDVKVSSTVILPQNLHFIFLNKFFSLFLWLFILRKRIEGKLPAWEGLRIVREKKF